MKTKLEIIEETVAYYSEDVNRRSVGENGDCMYFFKGKRCAVGRCMDMDTAVKAEEYSDGLCVASSIISEKYPIKDEYKGHDLDFWDALQSLHDYKSHWNSDGPTEEGRRFVEELKTEYS